MGQFISDEYKQLKNAASRRFVPLHSALIPSFRRYVRAAECDGHEWVFHRWTRTHTQPRSSPIVTTFGTYLRKKCGIEDRRVVLHSLRHTVKQQLQEAGAPDSVIADVLGHVGSGETHLTYGCAASIEKMTEWIECLPWANVVGSNSRRPGPNASPRRFAVALCRCTRSPKMCRKVETQPCSVRRPHAKCPGPHHVFREASCLSSGAIRVVGKGSSLAWKLHSDPIPGPSG